MSPTHSPKQTPWTPDGLTDLGKLGVDYFYNPDDWEVTHDVTDQWAVDEWLDDAPRTAVIELATLVQGPKAYAVHMPIEYDEDGNPCDWEARYFPTPEEARAALSKARPTQEEA